MSEKNGEGGVAKYFEVVEWEILLGWDGKKVCGG